MQVSICLLSILLVMHVSKSWCGALHVRVHIRIMSTKTYEHAHTYAGMPINTQLKHKREHTDNDFVDWSRGTIKNTD